MPASGLKTFLPHIDFQLLKSLWSSLTYFFCLMMRQLFSISERSRLQPGQFSTRTLLLQSHAVLIATVCGFALSCWITCRLGGSICCSKIFIYLSAFIVPSKTCKLPISYTRMHPHTIRYASFWTECWWQAGSWTSLFNPEVTASEISNKNVTFRLVWP